MAKQRQLKYGSSYSNINKQSLQQKAGESNRQYYRRLAKQANQRMVRIEDAAQAGLQAYNERIASGSPNITNAEIFRNITKYSYEKIQYKAKELKGGIKSEAMPGYEYRGFRFSETLLKDLTDKQVDRRIEMLKEFLHAPTSTIADVKTIYKKTARTFNKDYGTKFTWETFAKYYESGLADKFKKREEIGSDGGLEVIATLQKLPKEVIENLENVDEVIKTVDDEILQETIKKAIAEYGKDIKEFFS